MDVSRDSRAKSATFYRPRLARSSAAPIYQACGSPVEYIFLCPKLGGSDGAPHEAYNDGVNGIVVITPGCLV